MVERGGYVMFLPRARLGVVPDSKALSVGSDAAREVSGGVASNSLAGS
jgi:hypothetical protein